MPRYDLILSGGTILDPANDLETVSDLGISRGKIERVAPELDPSLSRKIIDVQGKWVMPGQIDTHAHVAGAERHWDPAIGYAMLAEAGTTTVLDMGGTGPNLINGIKRLGAGLNVAGVYAMVPGVTISDSILTYSALSDIMANVKRQGCIGVKILGGYHPFTPETTSDIIRVANDHMAYVAYHVGSKESGSNLIGMRELPAIVGGGHLHVAHVNSYCRGVIGEPLAECDEVLAILQRTNIISESYHAVQNGTNGRCDQDGNVVADVPRSCLSLGGYPPTREGLREAILDGYGSVVAEKSGKVVYVKGGEALVLFDANHTNVGMSFPVNLPSSAFRLTTAKNSSGEFVVDAVSTDGGSFPRNVAVQSTMSLVQFGALTPLEMAQKLSLAPARMLGLLKKGHFSPGADADITVLDPNINKPVMSLVAGRVIMLDGKSVGSGGTLLVTPEGKNAAEISGLPYEVIDLSQSKLYAGHDGGS